MKRLFFPLRILQSTPENRLIQNEEKKKIWNRSSDEMSSLSCRLKNTCFVQILYFPCGSARKLRCSNLFLILLAKDWTKVSPMHLVLHNGIVMYHSFAKTNKAFVWRESASLKHNDFQLTVDIRLIEFKWLWFQEFENLFPLFPERLNKILWLTLISKAIKITFHSCHLCQYEPLKLLFIFL